MDIIGKRYGKLIVVGSGDDYISPKGVRLKRWKCQCDCGNIINVTYTQLKRGQKSCGCISTRDDLTGKRFNHLTVMYPVEDYISPKGSHMSRWHCLCDCGKEVDALGMSLKNGDKKSCGCKSNCKRKHSNNKILPEVIIGKTYGYLTVKECSSYKGSIKTARFLCECICGGSREVSYNALVKNPNISCGCMNKKPIKKQYNNKKPVIGDVYDQLVVLDELEPHVTPNGSKQRIVRCRCSCGNVFNTRLVNAKKSGKCTSCLAKDRRVDITGKRYGKLVVLSMADDYISPSGHRLSRCNCLCDCGNKTVVNMSELVTGATKSCGCLLNHRGLLKDNKDLLDKYDFEKNSDIDIDTITARTSKKVWWKCKECGNSWYATVASQNDVKQHGCPYCSGRLVMKGKTDLLSQYPDVAVEWDGLRNKKGPDEISAKSSSKAWWKCKTCGKSWSATVANRTGNHSGCPHCNKENVNSFCEQAFYYYIRQYFKDAINSDQHLNIELDIYIPSKKVAIEYDGEAWHRAERRKINDNKKNRICLENDITMIRIREPKLDPINDCVVFERKDSTSDESLNDVIEAVLQYLGVDSARVDVLGDTGKILAQYASKKEKNSLLVCNPEIAKEWHPTKNGDLQPNQISKGSRRKVWWLGKCGHEWLMAVCDRTRAPFVDKYGKKRKPQGCPYCSGKKILIGFNDLESQYPEIAKEWHPIKNGDLQPNRIMAGSGRKVWWLGKCGHEWQATPNKRCMLNRGCPYCFKARRSPAVLCVETGIIYENGQSAADSVSLKKPSSIYRCCRGEAKTAAGYHWKYKDMS